MIQTLKFFSLNSEELCDELRGASKTLILLKDTLSVWLSSVCLTIMQCACMFKHRVSKKRKKRKKTFMTPQAQDDLKALHHLCFHNWLPHELYLRKKWLIHLKIKQYILSRKLIFWYNYPWNWKACHRGNGNHQIKWFPSNSMASSKMEVD